MAVTDLAFHSGVVDKLGYTCRLLRKAWRAGSRFWEAGSSAQLARLDALLWAFEPGEFIPHVRVRAGQTVAPLLAPTPIWLGETPADLPANAAACDVLDNLGPGIPPGFERFARVIDIVAEPADEVSAGRQRWRQYLAAGLQPRNLPQTQPQTQPQNQTRPQPSTPADPSPPGAA